MLLGRDDLDYDFDGYAIEDRPASPQRTISGPWPEPFCSLTMTLRSGKSLPRCSKTKGTRCSLRQMAEKRLSFYQGCTFPASSSFDLMMPEMTGQDFIGHLQSTRELASIPVVIFTASTPEILPASREGSQKPVELGRVTRSRFCCDESFTSN